ncbi:hypothetical protein T310_2388, partial [Rasamsonia emersonii CBS 393.64]
MSTTTTTTTTATETVRVETVQPSSKPEDEIKKTDDKADKADEKKDDKAAFYEDVHFLGDKEGRVVIRSPPTFANKLDERRYQLQHLAAAFRVFAKQGFDEGVAGHISLRDPINP